MSATPDSTLADPKQLIADLQRQLAASNAERDEALAERDEAMQRETATAEVLQIINASPGDLTPVFEAMLEKAMRLCEAQTGHLLRFENGAFSRAASRGIPEEFDNLLPRHAPMPDVLTRNSVISRLLLTKSVIHISDLREDEIIPDASRRGGGGSRNSGHSNSAVCASAERGGGLPVPS